MSIGKEFQFEGTAGGYFVVFLVTLLIGWVPLLGTAFVFNYTNEWLASNSRISGRRVQYSAGFGETLWFILVNSLFVLITLGIYTFWFVPKSYRYIADHLSYDAVAPESAAPVEVTTTL